MRSGRVFPWFALLLLAACGDKSADPGDDGAAGRDDTAVDGSDGADGADGADGSDGGDGGDTHDTGVPPESLSFDPEAPAIDCGTDAEAPLLDAVLADAGIARDRVGYSEEDWDHTSYGRFLDDPFLLSWFYAYLHAPLNYPCLGGQIAADLDHAATTPHPVATALGEAAALLDHPPGGTPIDPATAVQDLVDLSPLDPDLAGALVPVLAAMQVGVDARRLLEGAATESAQRLVAMGHGGVILDFSSLPDMTASATQGWVVGPDGPRVLFDPARIIAFAVEHADLGRFAGVDGVLEVDTDIGRVIVAGPGEDAPGPLEDVALYIDLGGNDTYVHGAGASTADAPVALHIDLGGSDTYTYVESDAGDDHLLPADDAGRYGGDDYYGPFSLSRTGRQGSGRFGIGMVFDLGGGDDHYRSLRMSQGWGHLGVGVLFDDGGDDVYLAEEGAQGAASMGIGLLMDLGDGDDVRRSYANSMGFGYVQGAGLAWDGGGDDEWYANPGKAEDGGFTIYYSPQLPAGGNATFGQGAGFGMRADSVSTFLSGGVGVLRDAGGHDTYTAGTFAQGSGYWQGTGLLLDGGGDDAYDAYYYAQGGAAHYAAGVLLDDGDGADQLNTRMTPNYMHFGAGHDFSVGVYVDEGGDDTYVYAGLAGGASNCQGIGLFVDNDGSDHYTTTSTYSTGLGNHSGECESRTAVHSIGLFMDAGGDVDSYTFPEGDHPAPADDSVFGFSWNGTDDEFGGAVDGDGETALHASGELPSD